MKRYDFRTLSVFYIDAIYIQLIVTRKWCLKKFTIITDIYAIYRLYMKFSKVKQYLLLRYAKGL